MSQRKPRLRSPKLSYDLELLAAMADETRQQILQFLCTPGAGEMQEFSVGSIAMNFDLTPSTVSHHLQALKRAGLVEMRRAGRQRFYRLNLETLSKSVGQFRDLLGLITSAVERNARRQEKES